MNNMFSNFTNLNSTYGGNSSYNNGFGQGFPFPCPPQNIPQLNSPLQEINTNKPYEVRGNDGELKGYFWYQGNSVDLVFNISGQITLTEQETYITVNQILKDLNLIVNIYNFRHEKVLEFSNSFEAMHKLNVTINENDWESKGASVTVSIDRELSSSTLVKGIYYIELIASHISGYCETLFDSNSCIFEVR